MSGVRVSEVRWQITEVRCQKTDNRIRKSVIKLAAFQASGSAHMKLHKNGTVSWWLTWSFRWQGLNSEPQNDEWRRMESLREIFFKSDRIHSFDVRSAGGRQVLARLWRVGCSMFDVHQFLFRFDRPFFWLAAGLNTDTWNLTFRTTCRQKNADKSLNDRFRVQGSLGYKMLISVALYPNVWISLFYPLGETWNLSRLMRNTTVRDQLGHLNWEPWTLNRLTYE